MSDDYRAAGTVPPRSVREGATGSVDPEDRVPGDRQAVMLDRAGSDEPVPGRDGLDAAGVDVFVPLDSEFGSEAPALPPDRPHDDPRAGLLDYAAEVALDITELLLPAAPPDWQRLELACSVTVAAVAAEAAFSTGAADGVRVEVPAAAVELVRLLRTVTVPLEDRAWWRVMLWRNVSGDVGYEFDYGQRPFPVDQLLPAAAYRADLKDFPRERLPVWLAAYLAAAERRVGTRIARHGAARAVPMRFVDPALMWARWATVAAAAVAIGSEWGPRILGSTAVFEATSGSGATLYLLPRDRVVLSGGLWDDPRLDAVYNDGAAPPDYYAGAPDWIDVPVLNRRATGGLLSFCYWWDGTGWYRGDSPEPMAIAAALPGLWTADTVIGVVYRALGASASQSAVAELVAAAESGRVTVTAVAAAFDLDEQTDLAGAFTQLALAGLTR